MHDRKAEIKPWPPEDLRQATRAGCFRLVSAGRFPARGAARIEKPLETASCLRFCTVFQCPRHDAPELPGPA